MLTVVRALITSRLDNAVGLPLKSPGASVNSESGQVQMIGDLVGTKWPIKYYSK